MGISIRSVKNDILSIIEQLGPVYDAMVRVKKRRERLGFLKRLFGYISPEYLENAKYKLKQAMEKSDFAEIKSFLLQARDRMGLFRNSMPCLSPRYREEISFIDRRLGGIIAEIDHYT